MRLCADILSGSWLMFLTFMVHEFTWLATNSFYLLLDDNNWLRSYCVIPNKIPLDMRQKVFKELLFTHAFVLLPLQILAGPFMLSFLTPNINISFTVKLFQFIFFNVIEDTIFYWVHRIMHIPWVFKNIHFKHHQFDSLHGHTFSLNGEYAHWIENLSNDLLPLLAGPYIFSFWSLVPLELFWVWIVWRQIRSADAHSGYQFIKIKHIYQGSAGHIHHHTLQGRKHNFGSYIFWDYICNTLFTV
jgi:sterol desaturase/sphingolipid hydroxylase (fatty acid hydroxylase superfamily)